jgi:hypothetical protein
VSSADDNLKKELFKKELRFGLDKGAGLTDNRTMAKIERPTKARKSAYARHEGRHEWRTEPPLTPPKSARKGVKGGRDKALTSAIKGAKSSPTPKLKKYLLHYAKGKYYLINLSLKKGGHDQKY